MIDVPLLRKALEYITEHPEDWRQGMWLTKTIVPDGKTYAKDDASEIWAKLGESFLASKPVWCGTTACLAGHVAVTILGGKPVFKEGDVASARVDMGDGVSVSVRKVAVEALGLTEEQGDVLFSSAHTLRSLWTYANKFTNGEIEIPLQFR